MKTILNKALILLSIIFAVSSCKSDDMNFKDVAVSPVNKLYEPADNKQVQLLNSATAALFFEWEASKAEDSGSPLYEVVFDKEGGNFSNPVYRVVADNGGVANYATITHKTLNKIAALAGVEAQESGTLIWTVVASRGINGVTARESKKVTIIRLAGFAEIPEQVYITGEASEAGTNLTDAIPFRLMKQGEFEIFTQLTAGKSYKFVNNRSGSPRTFFIDGVTLKEGGEMNADVTGIYRINLDYNIAVATITKVNKFEFFMCTPEQRVVLNYQGKGIWKGENIVPDFTTNWSDDRYAFRMSVTGADGNTTDQVWGSESINNNPPNSSSAPSYFYLFYRPAEMITDSRWSFSYKFPARNPITVDVIATLNAEGANYSHKIINK